MAVDNIARALAASGIRIAINHTFANETARDDYFTTNPSELRLGVYIVVDSQLQQWDGGRWIDKTAVVRGPAGESGFPDLSTTRVVYVESTRGSDTNSGASPIEPKETIGGAIAEFNATGEDHATIKVLDSGIYEEDFTVPQNILLDASFATVIGFVTIRGGSRFFVNRHLAKANNATMLAKMDSVHSYYRAVLSSYNGKTGVTNVRNSTSNSILFVDVEYMLTSFRGIQDFASGSGLTNGHIHFNIKDLYLMGNHARAIDAGGSNADLVGQIDHIRKDSGVVGCVGLFVGTISSKINVRMNEIELEGCTAYNNNAGGELTINCAKIEGEKLGKAVFPSKELTSIDYKPPSDVLASGNVTSGTLTSFIDSTQSWTTNQFAGKVFKLFKNGGSDFQYGICTTNTETTVNFDSEFIVAPCDGCQYEEIDTLELNTEDLPLILALNVMDNKTAIVLPESTVENERKYAHIYVELGNGANNAVVIARGADRIFGVKYFTLDFRTEGVRLYPHMWVTPHFDIVQTYNIKRLATAYFDNDESFASTDWVEVGQVGNLVYDNLKRFADIDREGIQYIRYTSLFERDFIGSWQIVVAKTGGVGEASFALGKREAGSEEITVLETRIASTRFGSGEGLQTVDLRTPLILNRNDEVVLLAKRTAANFTIKEGTNFDIQES